MNAIRVALRVRPESAEVSSSGSGRSPGKQNSIVTNGNVVSLHRHRENGIADISHQYTFDKVFEGDTTQEEVFTHVQDLIDESLLGYNVTIFAFGMTGSGKTHTISGQSVALGASNSSSTATLANSNAGIVPRTLHRVFSHLRHQAAANTTINKESAAMVFLTFVELYNNTFYDLLASEVPGDYNNISANNGSNSSGLKLHEHPVRGMHLTGSQTLHTPVGSAEEALALVHRGYGLRATAATNLNERSSRSHTVLTLEIVTREVVLDTTGDNSAATTGTNQTPTTRTRVGKINLVDLAGSERVKLSGAEGQTLEEAKQINKALSVLGDVLNSLSRMNVNADKQSNSATSTTRGNKSPEMKKLTHIPYRNSKLTMMLKDSLGGNAKTMMIATIRLSAAFYQQTLTSLQYAARARHIKCNPIANITEGDGKSNNDSDMLIQRHMSEVHRLKTQLDKRTEEFNNLKQKLEIIEKARAEDSIRSGNSQGTSSYGDSSGTYSHNTNDINAASLYFKSSKDRVISALDPNDPDYAAKYSAAMAAENIMVENYKKQIDSLQVQSGKERKELQDRMKNVIHSHEDVLAEKQKQYLGLETQLTREQTRIESLIRAKDNALYSKKTAELESAKLHDENRRQVCICSVCLSY